MISFSAFILMQYIKANQGGREEGEKARQETEEEWRGREAAADSVTHESLTTH